MKKIVAFLSTALLLASCGGNSPAQPSSVSSNGQDYSQPDASYPSGSIPGSSGNRPVVDSVENMGNLVYSLNRLDKADFSFNMTMTAEKTAGKRFAPQTRNLEDLSPVVVNDDYFTAYNVMLEDCRRISRELVDRALSEITLIDTRIAMAPGSYMMLSYDASKDEVRLLMDDVNSDCVTEIRLSYNEDGKEIVHYAFKQYGHIFSVDYCPGAFYTIKDYEGPNSFIPMYSYIRAENTDEGWRGFQYHTAADNAFLTGTGTIDLANNQLYVTFITEIDGAFFVYTDEFEAFREGCQLGSGDSIDDADLIHLKNGEIRFDGGCFNVERNCYSLNVKCFNGIKSVNFDDDMIDGSYGYLTQNASVETTTGQTINVGCYFSAEHGLLTPTGRYFPNGIEIYEDQEGNEFNYWDLQDTLCLTDIIVYNYGGPNETIYLEFDVRHFTTEADTAAFNAFLNCYGLSIVDTSGNDLSASVASLRTSSAKYKKSIFRSFFYRDYSFDDLRSELRNINAHIDSALDEAKSTMDNAETVDYNDMPIISDHYGILAAETTGTSVSVTSDHKIDASSITSQVQKSILFEQGAEYVLFGTFNHNEFFELSERQTYNTVAMTFSGKVAEVTFPTAPGAYELTVFIGKVNEGQLVPLTSSSVLSVGTFETYTIDGEPSEEMGGYYVYSIGGSDGVVNVDRTFVDTKAPTIDFGYEMEVGKYSNPLRFDHPVTAGDLIQYFDITDNVSDTFSNVSITAAGSDEPLASDEYVSTGYYVISATDEAGNTGTFAFSIEVDAEPEIEEPVEEDL